MHHEAGRKGVDKIGTNWPAGITALNHVTERQRAGRLRGVSQTPRPAEPEPTAPESPRASTGLPDEARPDSQEPTGDRDPGTEKVPALPAWKAVLLRSRQAHRPRTLLALAVLAIGTGLTLLPVLTFYLSQPDPSPWIADGWGNEVSARWSLRSCGIAYWAVALHLWIRGDTHVPPSPYSLYPRSIWLHLITLLLPVAALVAILQSGQLVDTTRSATTGGKIAEAIALISGTALMALALVCLPSRPHPGSTRNGTPGHSAPDTSAGRMSRALTRRLWYMALTCTLTVATAAAGLIILRPLTPMTGFSTSLSHPSSEGPDLIAHPQPNGTWSTSFDNATGSLLSHVVPTGYGPILLRQPSQDSDSIPTLMVTSLNPENGTVQWQQDLKKGDENNPDEYDDEPWSLHATDPDGRLIALHLRRSDGTHSAPSSVVVVLDAGTGAVTRKVDIDGWVRTIALTSDMLAVQIVDTSTPRADTRLLTYATTGPEAQRSGNEPEFSTPTQSWLSGATRDELLMTDMIPWAYPTPCTATLTDPRTGAEAASMDQVYDIHPHGWVERFMADDPAIPESSDQDSWTSLERELVNMESGASLNLNDMESTLDMDARGYFLTLGRYEAEDKEDAEWVEYGNVDISIPAGSEPIFDDSFSIRKVEIPRNDNAVALRAQEEQG